MITSLWINRLQEWDHRLFRQVFRPHSPANWLRPMRLVSASADGWLYPLVLPIFAWSLTGGLRLLAASAITFLFERALYRELKRRLRRRRPFARLAGVAHRLAPPDEFSFPSGHTAAAFAFAGLITAVFPPLALPVFLWAGLVAVSRVYLGVHFPADTLAGAVLGMACAMIGWWFTMRMAP
jgi:undecaprenyl-diphosphatase